MPSDFICVTFAANAPSLSGEMASMASPMLTRRASAARPAPPAPPPATAGSRTPAPAPAPACARLPTPPRAPPPTVPRYRLWGQGRLPGP
eukprot:5357967-Prymnesium_polylepis.1